MAAGPSDYLGKGISATQELAGWDTHQAIRSNQSRDYVYATTNLKKSGGGYGQSAHLSLQLREYNSNSAALREYERRVRTTRGNSRYKVLGQDLGIGDKSLFYEYFMVVRRDGTPKGRPAYWIYAQQGKWLLRASLYDRLDETFVSDALARQIVQSVSRNILANVGLSEDHYPIIFLPGVAGTQLWTRSSLLQPEMELWPVPHVDADMTRMLLDEDGVPIDSDVIPKDIIRSTISRGRPLHNQMGIYHGLMECIQSMEFDDGTSYIEGENLFAWGYDWRMDNVAQLANLDRYVNSIRVKTNSKKVILVGHSMGGLISRAYAVKHPGKVDTVISIGSPYAGSPKPFYGLLMGYTFGNPLAKRSVMKNLLQNAPSAYQLLPQYDFVIDTQTSQEIPNREVYDKIRYKDTSTGSNSRSLNKKLLDRAKPFYSIVGTAFNPVALPTDVKHYAIIGVGVQTLEGFVLRPVTPKDKYYLEYAGSKVVLDPFFGNGDGTVPLKSANIKDTTQTYFIQHEGGFYASGLHGSLTNNKVVQAILESIIKKVPFRLSGSSDPTRLIDEESDVDFTLRSDAHLSIRDADTGRMLGYNDEGVIEETLPGTFLAMEASEHASVSGIGRPVTVRVEGIRDGKFSLDVVARNRGRSTSFSYEEVNVQDGTVASFQVNPDGTTPSSVPEMTVTNGDQSNTIQPSLIGPTVEGDVYDFPRLKAKIVNFDFFESGRTPPPVAERKFQQTLDAKTTRFVFWHLQLDYPPLQVDTDLSFEAVWYMPDGREMNRQSIQYRPKAGWTRSYYAHGWGSDKGGSYKMLGTYQVDIVVDGTVLTSGQFTMTDDAGQRKPVFDFETWLIDDKLDVASSRLDQALQRSTDEAQQASYRRARDLVSQAKEHYLRYRGRQAPLFRGSTDPADCPYGLMKVLRMCEEAIMQSRANWQVSPRPLTMSDAAIRQVSESIRAADESIQQAVEEVLACRGWVTHRGPKGALVQSPPAFKAFTYKSWPLAIRVLNAAGDVDRAVLVTWHAKPQELSEMAFQEEAIAKHKSDHSDFRDLKSWQHWPGVSGHWFSYRYTWEGQEIKALIYQNAFGPLPWELRYLAPVDRFDMEECEEIVRSLAVDR